MEGDFIQIVITSNLQFNSSCRKKKYIDVTRTTYTNLEVLLQRRVDDCWKVDLNRSLSDSWERIHKIHTIEKRKTSPKKYMWSGVRLTKNQSTTRTDHVWPQVWTTIGKAAQNREKQEWENEKPTLDNARRLRNLLH